MLSKQQVELLQKALALVEGADQIVIQAGLPALGSGVHELNQGLGQAIGGLKLAIQQSSVREGPL
jgi:hypothetical protein